MEELQNLTPLYNKEFYLAYLCGEDVELPIPDGNTEHYLAYLCGMDVPIPDPLYTKEFYLAYKCGMDVELPEPGPYRIDQYLAKWCGMDVEVPEPMYRIEYWLAQLANSGELKTVSGNPISVSDALAKPAESLTIEILPQQSGSGDPSPDNVRPISGFTGVNVQRTGKNVLPLTNYFTSRFTVADDGTVSQNNKSSAPFSWLYENTVLRVKLPAGKYTLSECITVACTSTSHNVRVISSDNSINISIVGGAKPIGTYSGSFTLTETTEIGIAMKLYDGEAKFQLELGSTATAYEPYNGTTYSIDWTDEAGTVYGGSLDVTTGVLTKAPYYDSYNGEPLVGPWVSSMDKYVPGATPTTGAQVVDLGGTGTDVQLTATEVEMLLGNNTIWNDVDGDMTLEYLADGPADDVDALQILLGNRYVNNGAEDEATDREALDILLGGNTR